MVMLCGLRYDQTIKKQNKQLPVTIMNEMGGHPAASGAVET